MLAQVEDSGPTAPQLVLENAAGGGWALGVTIEELALLAEAIAARGIPRERVGFCLDTAHLWGAGYAISDPAAIDALLDDFESSIGLERLSMIHLNDSKAPLGSRLDRHEHIGAGQIGPVGLAHLLTRAARWPMSRSTSRRRGWTWAMTPSTSRGRGTSPPAGRWRRFRRRR